MSVVASEDLETCLCSFFDKIANEVPFQFYIAADRGGLSNDEAVDPLWVDSQRHRARNDKTKRNLQRSRYGPHNWRCTADVIRQSASANSEPRKNQKKTAKNVKQSNNKNTASSEAADAAGVSREDLRRRLHEKIAALHQQNQQLKTKKFSKEETQAFRKLKRSQKNGVQETNNNANKVPLGQGQAQTTQNTASSFRNRIEDKDDIETNFTFNQIVVKGTPSQEKRKEEELVETGVTVVKRRRITEALKDMEKKEKERAEWSAEKREEVERKEALDKAMVKATGARVFDSPARLKKALKAREKKHAKSVRTWNEKKKEDEAKRDEVAKKRSNNIKERIEKIKAKKRHF